MRSPIRPNSSSIRIFIACRWNRVLLLLVSGLNEFGWHCSSTDGFSRDRPIARLGSVSDDSPLLLHTLVFAACDERYCTLCVCVISTIPYRYPHSCVCNTAHKQKYCNVLFAFTWSCACGNDSLNSYDSPRVVCSVPRRRCLHVL